VFFEASLDRDDPVAEQLKIAPQPDGSSAERGVENEAVAAMSRSAPPSKTVIFHTARLFDKGMASMLPLHENPKGFLVVLVIDAWAILKKTSPSDLCARRWKIAMGGHVTLRETAPKKRIHRPVRF
jgi:hypothetical protein